MAAEPYAGYYASDPVWSAAQCAELWDILGVPGTTSRSHYHPLDGDSPTPPEDLGFGVGGFGSGPFGGTLVNP